MARDKLKCPVSVEKPEKDIELTDRWVDSEPGTGTGSVDTLSSEREQWDRSCDFILSLLGYCIGLGNALRFPYVCLRNGGGAFLVPFAICLALVGMPLIFLEMSLGQFLGRGSLRVWLVFPLFKGLGIGMMIINAIFALYHNIQMTWILYYLVNSFRSTLPWSVCDQSWNTEACFIKERPLNNSTMDLANQTSTNVTSSVMSATLPLISSVMNTTLPVTSSAMGTTLPEYYVNMTSSKNATAIRRSAVEEFWQYNVLQLSSGLGDFGGLPWHLAVCLLVAWIVVFLCVMKGIKLIGRIVYVTVLTPYILLAILLVKGLTLDGAIEGLEFYLKPDVSKLLSVQVWIEAGLQVFISLGAAWGPVITMASFNKFNNNCLRDSIIIAVVGEGTSFFCGLIVFTSLGFLAKTLDVPIGEVVGSGPGLGFIAYPEALLQLPFPQIWTVIFFLALFFIAIDTQFATVETVITVLMDMFPRLHKTRMLFTLAVCAVGYVLGLSMCTQGGIYIFQLLDWYTTILALPIFGFIECLSIGWVYGVARYDRDMEIMIGRRVPAFMRISWCFLSPMIFVCFFIFSLMTYVPPQYGSYTYPYWAQAFGWVLAAIPVLALVLPALHQLISYKHTSILQRLSKSLELSPAWRPNSTEHRQSYHYEKYTYPDSLLSTKLKSNVIGN